MKNNSRRDFLKLTGVSMLAGVTASSCQTKQIETKPKGYERLKLSVASYTFRNFSLDETLVMMQRLAIKYIALKSMHLPLESSPEAIKTAVEKVKKAGITLYGGGVIYMTEKEHVDQAFEYAKIAGMKTIIGVPSYNLLDLVDQKVKEYDIKVAIHNHGPGDETYPSPQSVYDKVKNLDQRIGLCMDIGHTMRIGIDPADAAEMYFDRLLDLHVRDVDQANADGKTVPIGRGVIDFTRFLNILIKNNYTEHVSLEYDQEKTDPLPASAECFGFLKGVLSLI